MTDADNHPADTPEAAGIVPFPIGLPHVVTPKQERAMKVEAKHIPPEAVEAAAKAAHNIAYKIDDPSDPDQWENMPENYKELTRAEARAALAAGLAAWPLAFPCNMAGLSDDVGTPSDDVFILPLTENPDDKA